MDRFSIPVGVKPNNRTAMEFYKTYVLQSGDELTHGVGIDKGHLHILAR